MIENVRKSQNSFQLKSRFVELISLIKKNKPDIVIINELKLNDEEARGLFSDLPDFNVHFRCRNSIGRGVALLVRDSSL